MGRELMLVECHFWLYELCDAVSFVILQFMIIYTAATLVFPWRPTYHPSYNSTHLFEYHIINLNLTKWKFWYSLLCASSPWASMPLASEIHMNHAPTSVSKRAMYAAGHMMPSYTASHTNAAALLTSLTAWSIASAATTACATRIVAAPEQ